jgi:hypothetical protein
MNSYPVKCRHCGREYSKKAWNMLPSLGVQFECLDTRECRCGDTLAVEVEGYGGANDHEVAVRNCEAL